MGETLLEVKELRTSFFTERGVAPAVDGISFTVQKGRVLGIVGESGSGKSVTSLSVMRLLQEPAGKIMGGQILFKGQDLTKLTDKQMQKIRGSQISMVFQDPMTALNPIMTVGDQIAEGIALHQHLDKAHAKQEAIRMLETVGISADRAGEYPHQFSGGMKQRVVIAMALACRPDLIIADEPTTALDVTIQAQILRLMKKLQQETGTAIMLITHDLGVIRQMSDDVIVMYCGQIVENGTVGQIFSHMSHPYTMGLLASIPTLRDDGGRLKAIEGMVPSLYDLPTGCRFHPRCPYATEQCRANCPELREVEPGHYTRCFRDSFGKE